MSRITCIGGGHGLARAVRAARQIADDVAAVVTAADDGGSSGILRNWLGIPAPGDLRMALAAMADDDVAELLQYRFKEGDLAGHPLGNLLVAALADLRGDFVEALTEAARIAGVSGRVCPATAVPLTLHAIIEGRQVAGQVAIAKGAGPVSKLWLDPPEPPAPPQAVAAIEEADLIVLGPGSLFTSILAALLVPGIARATRAARRVVLILNLSEQIGETRGMDGAAHLEALTAHIRRLRLDAVLVHDGPTDRIPLPVTLEEGRTAIPVVRADLATAGLHDPDKLATALKRLL